MEAREYRKQKVSKIDIKIKKGCYKQSRHLKIREE